MSIESCKCGHLRTEHFDFKECLDEKMNKHFRQWVAKGLGKCSRCNCEEFTRV